MYIISRKIYVAGILMMLFALSAQAQKTAIKTNLFYWATTTPNLQVEFALSKKTTLELGAGINTFVLKKADGPTIEGVTLGRESKFKHWLIQPEYRYWTCEVFNGHFFGLHLHGAQFNVGGIDVPVGRLKTFKDHRYEGYLYGAGVSYGYQWVLNRRWNIELSLGGGFARVHFNEFPCTTCGSKLDEGDYTYWGVTKTALSIIYFLK